MTPTCPTCGRPFDPDPRYVPEDREWGEDHEVRQSSLWLLAGALALIAVVWLVQVYVAGRGAGG